MCADSILCLSIIVPYFIMDYAARVAHSTIVSLPLMSHPYDTSHKGWSRESIKGDGGSGVSLDSETSIATAQEERLIHLYFGSAMTISSCAACTASSDRSSFTWNSVDTIPLGLHNNFITFRPSPCQAWTSRTPTDGKLPRRTMTLTRR